MPSAPIICSQSLQCLSLGPGSPHQATCCSGGLPTVIRAVQLPRPSPQPLGRGSIRGTGGWRRDQLSGPSPVTPKKEETSCSGLGFALGLWLANLKLSWVADQQRCFSDTELAMQIAGEEWTCLACLLLCPHIPLPCAHLAPFPSDPLSVSSSRRAAALTTTGYSWKLLA